MLGTIGFVLLGIGLWLPDEWFGPIPRQEELPPPEIRGVTLLRVSFVLEALVLWGFALTRFRFTRLPPSERLGAGRASHPADGGGWLLVGIAALALALRTFGITSDLWLDEITPVLDYRGLPVLTVMGSYLSSNNHMLYTLLMKLSIAGLGESEWSIRLFAVLFGAATAPALYWIARMLGLSRAGGLSAALLLAVSYHHIFFSQNARGYSGYLLFSLISTGLFVRGLEEDRFRIWIGYVGTMLLDLGLHLNSGFVLASHAVVAAAAAYGIRRSGSSGVPLLKRVAGVLGLTSLLGFQLYAMALPEIHVFVTHAYVGLASGYAPFSAEFLQEMVRGVAAGFGPGLFLAAAPFLLLAAAGAVLMLRTNWALWLALGLPLVLTAAYLLLQGLTFTPRFFLLALPLAVLAATRGIFAGAELIAQTRGPARGSLSSRLATAVVLVLALVSTASLASYYSIPKQPYRASINYLESIRAPENAVIVIDIAEKGYRFYAVRTGLAEPLFYVRSLEALDSVLAVRADRKSFLVTTFHRSLRLRHPELFREIAEKWRPKSTFPATIGDGEITVWEQS